MPDTPDPSYPGSGHGSTADPQGVQPRRDTPPRSVMGFDYGRRRVGVAVGQETTCTASALTTLESMGDKPDWEAIAALIDEWRPDALVVGLPYHMDGSEHELTRAARKFGRQLHGRFHLPVHEMDERLSSHAARDHTRAERAAGRRKKTRKTDIDKMAAQIILQDWLGQQEKCRD